jgi:streptogramin lyase
VHDGLDGRTVRSVPRLQVRRRTADLTDRTHRESPLAPLSMRLSPIRPRSSLTLLAALVAAGLPQAAGAATTVERTTEVPTHITAAGMTDIAAAADGALWIAAQNKGSLLSVRPDGQVAERPITGLGRTPSPREIAGDAMGNLWSTDPAGPLLIRSTKDGESADISTGEAGTRPLDVATGADGNVWFTTAGKTQIGRVTPSGDVTLWPVSTHPARITSGSGETAAWFTTDEGQVGRVALDGSTTTIATVGGTATGIAQGSDGNVWVTTADSVNRVTPSGTVSTFTAGLPSGAGISDIAATPSGHLWFTVRSSNAIGRITVDGAITIFATTNAKAIGGQGATPDAIAVGPGGVPIYFGQNPDPLVSSVVGTVSTVGTPTGAVGAAEEVDVRTAVLTAQVSAEDGATTVSFEYGITAKLGQLTPGVQLDASLPAQPVRLALTDLEPKRTYFYRVNATNTAGQFQSPTLQFTTKNVPLPTTPPLPGLTPKPAADDAPSDLPPDAVAVPSTLKVGATAAKLGKKGIVKVKLICPSTASCDATVEVTAKFGKGKKAKSVVIARKPVTVAGGKTSSVGFRVNAAGQRAIRKAGKKGLATLAVVSVGTTKTRARLTLKR